MTGCQNQKVDEPKDKTPSVDQNQSNTEDSGQESETSDKTTPTEDNMTSKNEGTLQEIAKHFLDTFTQGEFKKNINRICL